MSRRKVVKLNLDFVNKRIKECFRHNVVFCEKMGRGPNWVTDWNRQPKPKNLPSPEEAAKMCAILQAEPEEILVEQDDIDLVKSIIDRERTSQKEPATQAGDGKLEPMVADILNLYRQLLPENRKQVLDYARFLLSNQVSASAPPETDD